MKLLLKKKTVKQVASLIAISYCFIIAILLVIVFCTGNKSDDDEVFLVGSLIIGVLISMQTVFFLLPIEFARQKRPSKNKILLTVIFSGLAVAVLITSCGLAFAELIREAVIFFLFLIVGIGVWIVWACAFYKMLQKRDKKKRYILGGKIILSGCMLEILVAIPMHVIVRRRDECCGGIGTAIAIIFGISMMLLCFGPAVFMLYRERWRRKYPKVRSIVERSMLVGIVDEEARGKRKK